MSDQSENWQALIEQMEAFFSTCKLPLKPIQLTPHEKIVDINLFISAHLQVVKANIGKQSFRPYLSQLYSLYNKLNKKKKPK